VCKFEQRPKWHCGKIRKTPNRQSEFHVRALDAGSSVRAARQVMGGDMSSAAFLLSLTWGILSLFFVLLVRIGARRVPKPEPRPTELHALFVFRIRCVLGPGHFEKRIQPRAKYHLEPLTLKTTVLDPADNSQSFRFTGFL
jgi:hypothetical protein